MMFSLVKNFILLVILSTFMNPHIVSPLMPLNLPVQSNCFQPGSLQCPSSINSTLPSNKFGRLGLFTDVFYKTVQSSQEILQVFNMSYSSNKLSMNVFKALNDSLTLSGVAYPESLSKGVADAIFLTYPFMTQKDLIFTISDSVALYLVSQGKLNADNHQFYANQFANAILNNYPKATEPVNDYTLTRSIPNGVIDFLKSNGVYSLDRVQALSLELATNFFAMSFVRRSSKLVSVVDPPNAIPSASTLFGISAFTESFLTAVDSSPLLKSLFYVDRPAQVVGTAWFNAISIFCDVIKCTYNYSTANYDDEAILLTYDRISKQVFTQCIARAYAMTLIYMGKLVPENAARDAQTVATIIQQNLSQLSSNADLQARVGAYFSAFQSLNDDNADFKDKFAVHIYNIGNAMYSESDVQKRRYS